MKFLLTTCPGIEDIVAQELKENFGKVKTKLNFGCRGRVLADLPRFSKKLFQLRSIHHIIQFLSLFKIRRSKEGLEDIYDILYNFEFPNALKKAKSFRITSERMGKHEFTSVEIQKFAGQAIVDKYEKKVDLKDFEVNVRVDVIGEKCYVGIQLTKESLHKRKYRVANHPASLKPTLAYAMVKLAYPNKGDILLDPMCGCGTIPIEAALTYGKKIKVIGIDISKRFLSGAIRNSKKAGVEKMIRFIRGDCRELEKIVDSVDEIVTNPPYGVRMGNEKMIRSLYYKFLNSASKVLNEDGRILILSLRGGIFRNIVNFQREFFVLEERIVGHGSLYPHLFILKRL